MHGPNLPSEFSVLMTIQYDSWLLPSIIHHILILFYWNSCRAREPRTRIGSTLTAHVNFEKKKNWFAMSVLLLNPTCQYAWQGFVEEFN